MIAIDLFCGLGGWTEGLLAEGYYVVGFDIERHRYPRRAPQPVSDAGKSAPMSCKRLPGAKGGKITGWPHVDLDSPLIGEWDEYPAQLVLQSVLTLHGKQFKDAALIVASPPCQEYSYMAMPWSRAKAIEAEYRNGTRDVADLTRLFDACFRIQREACEAAGRHIPMVVENVRGACKWVGRSRWNYGSYHLWGDVPALMPMTRAIKSDVNFNNSGSGVWNRGEHIGEGQKVPGFRFDGSGKSFQTASVDRHTRPDHIQVIDPERGTKGYAARLGDSQISRKHGSKSKARKAARAAVAKIPLPLAQHIARYWKTQRAVA
jgi:hypothetical protein